MRKFNREPHEEPAKRTVMVTLDCGCTTGAMVSPMHKNSKYVCPNNLGHGYNVAWVRYVLNGVTRENQ